MKPRLTSVLTLCVLVVVTASLLMVGCQNTAYDGTREYEDGNSSIAPFSIDGSIDYSSHYNWRGIPVTESGSAKGPQEIRGLPDFSRYAVPTRPDFGPGDEVWIIARTGDEVRGATEGPRPYATIMAKGLDSEELVPLPLKHTAVTGTVSGFAADMQVRQQYENPYDTKIEAIYVFPLPQDAAVTDFVMTVGDRTIRGLIREREEAEAAYQEAKRQGYTAAIMTQERPNIFTQKVANIEPGKRIDVTLQYFNTVGWRDGEFEFVLPLVVGPRFNPPGSKDGIGAVPRGKGATSMEQVAVQYLAPNERSGHDVSVDLRLATGVPIQGLSSPSHKIRVDRGGFADGQARVQLAEGDTLPNRDFVLRWRLAGERTRTAMLVNRGPVDTSFALMVIPPADLESVPRVPCQMIFVLDCSGSMGGAPMDKVKATMTECIAGLDEGDTFQIIGFSNSPNTFALQPVQATAANRKKGLAFVKSLQASGGTMMLTGVQEALRQAEAQPDRQTVITLMTDGYIGNEAEIVREVQAHRGLARVFAFGVGSSVNRYLITSVAEAGGGAAAFIDLKAPTAEAVGLFYRQSARPALSDIRIDWGGLTVREQYPRALPTLYPGQPVLVCGRFTGTATRPIQLTGVVGGERRNYDLKVDPSATANQHPGIRSVWARMRLKDLHMALIQKPGTAELVDEMTRFSLEERVLCEYTAFLAVDSSRVTEGTTGVTVHQPVPVPDGVRYETTVAE